MKIPAMFMALLLCASALSAQAPLPTEVKGHLIGEAVDDFFRRAGYPIDLCGEKKPNIDKELCEAVERARSGQEVTVALDPKFEKFLLHPIIHAAPLLYDFAVLDGGKLSWVQLIFFQGLAEIAPDLLQKYGKPTSADSDTLQNGYGAKFEVGRATWQMPDGAAIVASEDVTAAEGSYVRTTKVQFLSKEQVARIATANPPKNVFD